MSYRHTYHVFMSYPCMCVSFTYEYLHIGDIYVSVCRPHIYMSIYMIGREGHQISAVDICHICVGTYNMYTELRNPVSFPDLSELICIHI